MNLSALGPFFRYARTKQPTPGTQDLGFEPIWAQLLHRISGAGVPYPQKYQPVACGCKGVVGLTPYWPGTSATVTGVIWLYQSDEPDTAKTWRPVVAVTFKNVLVVASR